MMKSMDDGQSLRFSWLLTAEEHLLFWQLHQAAIAADRELSDRLAREWSELDAQESLQAHAA